MASEQSQDSTPSPLVVDLDGTLVATDTLWESVMLLIRDRPWSLFSVASRIPIGKAAFKSAMADLVLPDPATLPYRDQVLGYIREAMDAGRPVFLVTAADQRIADGVFEHLSLFQEAVGSQPERNLKSGEKARYLAERFGEGFEYLGDSKADLAVWSKADVARAVAPSPTVWRALQDQRPEAGLLVPTQRLSLKAIVKALRPHQWAKNALLFVPAILAHQYGDLRLMLQVLCAFISFSLCASAVYVANDLLDLEQDRQHRSKRRRPFASGRLSIPFGLVLGAGTLLVGVGLAMLTLPSTFVAVLLGYVLITSAYSVVLKRKMIIDVVTLASLFTYRVIAGGVAAGVALSFWLLAFSMFFFTGLAFAKRYSELRALQSSDRESTPGRNYQVADLDIIASVGPASGLLGVLVFALYINSEEVVTIYPEPRFMWLICPILLYWVTRVWFLAARELLDDDPVIFAIKDKLSWAAGIAVVACVGFARFWPA